MSKPTPTRAILLPAGNARVSEGQSETLGIRPEHNDAERKDGWHHREAQLGFRPEAVDLTKQPRIAG